MLSHSSASFAPTQVFGHNHGSASDDEPARTAAVDIDPAVDAVFSSPLLCDNISRQALAGAVPRPTTLQQQLWVNLRRVNAQFRDAVAQHGPTKESIRTQRNLDLGRAKYTSLREHKGVREELDYSPNGQLAFSLDVRFGNLFLWRLAGPKPTAEILLRDLGLTTFMTFAFSADSAYLFAASSDVGVLRWELSQCPPTWTEVVPSDVCMMLSYSLYVSPWGIPAISVRNDSVRVFDLTKVPATSVMQNISNYSDSRNALNFSPDGSHVASMNRNNSHLAVWNLAGAVPVCHTEFQRIGRSCLISLRFSGDNTRMVDRGEHHTSVFDLRPGIVSKRALVAHGSRIRTVEFSPDGTRVLGGADNGSLFLWDLNEDEPVGLELNGHTEGYVTFAKFSPDGTRGAQRSQL